LVSVKKRGVGTGPKKDLGEGRLGHGIRGGVFAEKTANRGE